MATLTLWFDGGGTGIGSMVAGVHAALTRIDPGTNSTLTGVGFSPGSRPNTDSFAWDTQTNSTTFTADVGGVPVYPDGTITTTANIGDCWRTAVPLSGSFATGNWTFQFSCVKNLTANNAAGAAGFRLYTSANEDGSSATERGGGQLWGNAVTLSTSQTDSVYTGSITGFSVTNEYLFVELGWDVTVTPTGMISGGWSVAVRKGTTGCQVVTSDFTQTTGKTHYLEGLNVTNVDAGGGATDIAWTSPASAGVGDGQLAQFVNTPFAVDEYSDYLHAEAFGTYWDSGPPEVYTGFGIDTSATITKITAQVLRYCDGASAVQDDTVYLVVGGSTTGANKSAGAYWSTSWEVAEYTWTSSLPSVSDVNASDFGLQIGAINRTGGGEIAFVDQMRIMVEYTLPSGAKFLALLGVGS